MVTNATKTLEMAGGQNSPAEAWQCGPLHDVLGKHGHPDGGRYVPKNVEGLNSHGWLIFGLLARDVRVRETGDVRMRGEQVLIQSLSPPRKRQSSQIVAEDGHAALGKRKKRMGVFLDLEGSRPHHTWSFMWADSFWIMWTEHPHTRLFLDTFVLVPHITLWLKSHV